MDTIVAISTAPGIGGIGIIRMSGENCFEILDKIFIPKNKQKTEEMKGYNIKYGKIIEPGSKEIIDEVLVSYFKAPKSYTTENMCEINSHGGTVVVKKILEICLNNGARLAEPGEFTKKSFINGRIDLSQVESIIDIINAKSNNELKASINQLEGSLSRKISEIKKNVIDLLVDIDASIDYPEYDVEEVTNEKAKKSLENLENRIKELYKSFENGKIIKDGISVAIIGKPNSGKSSLLNNLLNEERAIVTNIEGTTRDTIEEYITIKGIPFKIIDTAGIRESINEVENIGIEKSKNVAESADLILAVFDNSKEFSKEDEKILEIISNKKAIIILNKDDINEKILEKNEKIINSGKKIIKTSMIKNVKLLELYEEISKMFDLGQINKEDEVLITNIRHKKLLEDSLEHLNNAKNALISEMPIDIISINIKEILADLGKITGENVTEDVIKEIFSKFCLGK